MGKRHLNINVCCEHCWRETRHGVFFVEMCGVLIVRKQHVTRALAKDAGARIAVLKMHRISENLTLVLCALSSRTSLATEITK